MFQLLWTYTSNVFYEVDIILTCSMSPSNTVVCVVIFEYKCMHVVLEYKCMHL